MNKGTHNIIIFINNNDEVVNLYKRLPNKSQYAFIFNNLSLEARNELSQLMKLNVNKISSETLFQSEGVYYINENSDYLQDLISTLTHFQSIHLYLIVTSSMIFNNLHVKKTDTITLILDNSIYGEINNDIMIDQLLSIDEIPYYFVKFDNIRQILLDLHKKYHFTFNEAQIIKQLLIKIDEEIETIQKDKLALTKVIDNMHNIIVLMDINGKIEFVNPLFAKITGLNRSMIIGKNLKQVFNQQNLHDKYHSIMSRMHLGKPDNIQIEINNGDISYYLELYFTPILNEFNQLMEVLIVINDITELVEKDKLIQKMQNIDPITGVWNRKYFIDRTKECLEIAAKEKSKMAIIILDINNYKEINETYGQNYGDSILKEVASRVDKLLSPENIFSRYYCDEFMFIIPKLGDKEEAIFLTKNIINHVNQPFCLNNQAINLSINVGIVVYPDDGNTTDELLSNLKITLYTVKNKNVNLLKYNYSMRETIIKRLEIENNIYQAIANREFILYYQPIVDINTGNLTSIETLLRWHSKDKGVLAPNYFLDYIEKTGHIVKIGEETMKDALNNFRHVQHKFEYPFYISFNLSTKQLLNTSLVENLTKIINETNFDPQHLMFEITESITTESINNSTSIFNQFSNLGITFSMDDFGTGYSSLCQLKNYPIKKIKVDKIFIHKMEEDHDYQMILKGIITIAHSMNYLVVAEGVETKSQLELLKRLNCDEIQGYYICKPIPFEELTTVLKNNNGNFSTLIN